MFWTARDPPRLDRPRHRGWRGRRVLTLDQDAATTTTAGKIEDPSFRSPTTIAKADGRYLVVNADFGTNRSPFTVSSVAT
jgi:hypothetical protein